LRQALSVTAPDPRAAAALVLEHLSKELGE
jgi:hypothetical protein